MKMKDLQIAVLEQDTVRPFTPYLLPQVFRSIESGEKMLLLGAYAQGHSLGAAAVQQANGVLLIRSLYVDRSVRRQGIGEALLRASAAAFDSLGTPVSAACAEYMVLPEENAGDIAAFLHHMKFEKPQSGNRLYEVESRAMRQRPLLKKAFSADFQKNPHVELLSSLSPTLMKSMEETEAPAFLKPSAQRFGILRQASTAWVQEERVMGWLLVRQGFDGEIILSAAYVGKDAPATCFVRLLEATANRLYLMMGRDFRCYVSTISDYAGRLVDKVAGEEKIEHATFVASTAGKPRWLR